MQGWRPDGTFVIGNTLYSPHLDPRRVQFDLQGNRVAGGFGAAGSSGEWSAAAEILFAQGYETYGFVLLASLAAPLMQTFKQAGMALAIKFPERNGRELMVQALTSPWGDRNCLTLRLEEPLDERLRSYRLLNGLPAYYEDLLRLDPYTRGKFMPETLDESRLLFCCNTDSLLPEDKAIYLDPRRLRSTVLEMSSFVPETSRLDEKKVRLLLNRNYGHAGPRFYQYVVRHRDAVLSMLGTLEDRFYADIRRSTLDMRPYSALLACVSTTALVASKTGLLAVTPDRLTDWMLARISDNQTGHPIFTKTPEEVFSDFLQEQDKHLCICTGDDSTIRTGYKTYVEPKPTDTIEVKLEYKRNRLLIARRHLKHWLVGKGHKPLYIHRWLKESGILLRDMALNLNARINGRRQETVEGVILDARAPVCRQAIQAWCARAHLDLPPHETVPEFLSLRERQARARRKQADRLPDELPESPGGPASPPPAEPLER